MIIFVVLLFGASASGPISTDSGMVFSLVNEYAILLPIRVNRHRQLKVTAPLMEECPPGTMWIEGESDPIVRLRKLGEGSSSGVFAYSENHVVKTIESLRGDRTTFVDDALMNEEVVMHVLGMKTFKVDMGRTKSMSAFCESRSLVSPNLGEALGRRLRFLDNPAGVLGIAIAGLGLLENLHRSGFVHGDVDFHNFLMDSEQVLYLIDFGLTTPFVNAFGDHIAPDVNRARSLASMNPAYLSPWHLLAPRVSEYQPSRRDDIFRFAEMLYMLTDSRYAAHVDVRAKNGGLLELKINHQVPHPIPVLRDFYTYALGMEFSETPQYGEWIQLFEQAVREIGPFPNLSHEQLLEALYAVKSEFPRKKLGRWTKYFGLDKEGVEAKLTAFHGMPEFAEVIKNVIDKTISPDIDNARKYIDETSDVIALAERVAASLGINEDDLDYHPLGSGKELIIVNFLKRAGFLEEHAGMLLADQSSRAV